MNGPARAAAVALLAGATGAAAWLVGRAETPQQPLSLGIVNRLRSEAMQGADRVGKTLTRVPQAQEIEIGRAMAQRLEARYVAPEDLPAAEAATLAERQRYVEAVVATLVERGRLRRPAIPYRVRVLTGGMVNAYALPGGFVSIEDSLLDLLASEAEVAAVLGHEIAHVDLGHAIERVQVRVHAERLDVAPLTMIAALGDVALHAGFDDDQEAEADRRGAVYATHAGYHPEAAAAALRRLEALYGGAEKPPDRLDREIEGMVRGALDDYFRTHPGGPERIARLERALREERLDLERTPYYVGRENRRLWVPRAERELPAEFLTGRLDTGRGAAFAAP